MASFIHLLNCDGEVACWDGPWPATPNGGIEDGKGGKNSCALGHGFVRFVALIVLELAREFIDSDVWNAEEFDVLFVMRDGYGVVDNPSWCGNV